MLKLSRPGHRSEMSLRLAPASSMAANNFSDSMPVKSITRGLDRPGQNQRPRWFQQCQMEDAGRESVSWGSISSPREAGLSRARGSKVRTRVARLKISCNPYTETLFIIYLKLKFNMSYILIW